MTYTFVCLSGDIREHGVKKFRQIIRISLIKCSGLIAVDIQHTQQSTCPVHDRNNQFGASRTGTCDMTLKSLYTLRPELA